MKWAVPLVVTTHDPVQIGKVSVQLPVQEEKVTPGAECIPGRAPGGGAVRVAVQVPEQVGKVSAVQSPVQEVMSVALMRGPRGPPRPPMGPPIGPPMGPPPPPARVMTPAAWVALKEGTVTSQVPVHLGKISAVQLPVQAESWGRGRVELASVALTATTQEPTHLGKVVSVQLPVQPDSWDWRSGLPPGPPRPPGVRRAARRDGVMDMGMVSECGVWALQERGRALMTPCDGVTDRAAGGAPQPHARGMGLDRC